MATDSKKPVKKKPVSREAGHAAPHPAKKKPVRNEAPQSGKKKPVRYEDEYEYEYEEERPRTKSGAAAHKKKASSKPVKKKKKNSPLKILLFIVEIFVLLAMVVVLYGVLKGEKVGHYNIKEEEIVINPQVEEKIETTMKGYRNIALFGVDSTTGALDKNTRAGIFMELESQGANNINLVTPTHYVPQIIEALEIAREEGMNLPVVYNTSGYERAETIRMLEGYVDIYLPDMKYMDSALAAEYSGAPDYPPYAKALL